jgi:prepilin-type N-terminal cleavage/methylation domain-containing protein
MTDGRTTPVASIAASSSAVTAIGERVADARRSALARPSLLHSNRPAKHRLGSNGLTLIEILLVIVLIGILAGYGLPRLANISTTQSISSARVALVGLLANARYTAIQRGGSASFILSNNQITVQATNPVTGVTETVGNVQDLNGRYGVTVQPTSLTLIFDPRGVGTASSQTTVSITKGSYGTSIVISAAGRVIQ